MNYEYMIFEKATRQIGLLKKWLIFITGVDTNLLERCPESEERKFTSLGAAMLITTALSFVSAWIAIGYIFPELENSSFMSSTWKHIITILISILWALIIFNLQRFIVSGNSHTSDSDGAGFKEFFINLPAIILSVVIGLSIAMPLEVEIFKPEIDLYLSFGREKERIDNEELAELYSYSKILRNCSELIRIDQKIGSGEISRCLPKKIVDSVQNVTYDNSEITRALEITEPLKHTLDAKNNEIDNNEYSQNNSIDTKNNDLEQSEDSTNSIARKVVLEDIAKELSKIEDRKSYDQMIKKSGEGLVRRASILFDRTPFFAYSVLLIIIFIQLTPVLIKVMASKSPYNYFEDMQNRMVLAHGGIIKNKALQNGGIEPRAIAVFDEQGKCSPVTIYHYVNQLKDHMKKHFNEENRQLTNLRLEQSSSAWKRLKHLINSSRV